MPRALSFTFDDGPDETWTPLGLERLARCEATATFFMVGERVLALPALARTVLAAGHDVQLHCPRHIRHTQLTEAELQRDTAMALATLQGFGARTRLWRAPCGVCTGARVRVSDRLGLRLVRWSINPHDWLGNPPRIMLVHARSGFEHGGTAFMHDALGPGARRAGCWNTLPLLPALAMVARAHGLALGPMRPDAQHDPPAISQHAIEVSV